MKYPAIILAFFAIQLPPTVNGAGAEQPLVADAAAMSSTQGKTWKSDVLKLKLRDGSVSERILVIEFSPNALADEVTSRHAKAKLSLATPPEGPLKVSSSIGTSFRDVRLQERDGLRTITFIRALDTISRPTKKTQRNLATYWSVAFTYELKGDRLLLKGFPKDAIDWGVTPIVAPTSEIAFDAVK